MFAKKTKNNDDSNSYTNSFQSSFITKEEKKEEKPIVSNSSNEVKNTNIINKNNSRNRMSYGTGSEVDIKMIESKPIRKFEFNIKAFICVLIAVAFYFIFVSKFLGNLYDKYIFEFFFKTFTKSITEGQPDIIIALFGLFVPLLTLLFMMISIVGYLIYNFACNGEKIDMFKSFIGKSFLYSALLAIIIVTVYRYTKIDIIIPIIKVLTFNYYQVLGFTGI